jgi:two-component system cell cycle response regulator
VRKIDLVAKIDERGFLLVLPNTHFPGALTVAERISREARPQRGAVARASRCRSGCRSSPTRTPKRCRTCSSWSTRRSSGRGKEQGGKICLFQHQGYLYAPDD